MKTLKKQWVDSGWIVITPCSAKYNSDDLDAAAELTARSKAREVNAYAHDASVRALATDPETLFVLKSLHGGVKPFPFQTLNFPRGTKQKIHNDLIHFSTYPQGMMAAAWVALEDIKPDSGPLHFYPGSHKLGMQYYDELGVRRDGSDEVRYADYEVKLAEYIKDHQLELRIAPEMKKGQVLMWTAALLHGGSEVLNASRTRLSQVNHYYFEGTEHAWVPRLSTLEEGRVQMRAPKYSRGPIEI
jgi:ectoine hydroxylase-related dioxygenase (phytanoyl-CoA dioxygenase family)